MNRRASLNRISQFMGLAMTFPSLTGILNGCTEKKDPAMELLFINKKQLAIITSLSEEIIPRTETPGAIDAGVPEFIELLLKDVFLKQDAIKLLADLEKFNKECNSNSNHDFIDSSAEQKVKYLNEVSLNSNNNHEIFMKMNGLVVGSYFTSQAGMTQSLNYIPNPGKYKACQALDVNDKIIVNDRL